MAEQDKPPMMPQGAGTPFAAGNFTLSPASASMSFAAGEVVFQAIREVSELLLQAVIVPGNKVSEGRLIEAVTTIWFDIVDLLRKDPSVAFQIPWHTWEEIMAGSYERAGFDEVILTPRSGDRGKDVIATMRGHGTIRVINQVKATN
jgi:Restriction endonuclease